MQEFDNQDDSTNKPEFGAIKTDDGFLYVQLMDVDIPDSRSSGHAALRGNDDIELVSTGSGDRDEPDSWEKLKSNIKSLNKIFTEGLDSTQPDELELDLNVGFEKKGKVPIFLSATMAGSIKIKAKWIKKDQDQ